MKPLTVLATAELVSVFLTIVAMWLAFEIVMKKGRHFRKLWKKVRGDSDAKSAATRDSQLKPENTVAKETLISRSRDHSKDLERGE
jgi:uncharacterized protein YacL